MCCGVGQGVWEGKCCPKLPCSSLSDDKSWEGGGTNSHVTLSRRDSSRNTWERTWPAPSHPHRAPRGQPLNQGCHQSHSHCICPRLAHSLPTAVQIPLGAPGETLAPQQTPEDAVLCCPGEGTHVYAQFLRAPRGRGVAGGAASSSCPWVWVCPIHLSLSLASCHQHSKAYGAQESEF